MPEAAHNLREVEYALDPSPLTGDEEFEAYYRGADQIKAVRGQDAVRHLALGLDRSPAAPPYKAFLMGRAGVGKSTEITRLALEIRDRYETLRFNVRTQLDPREFTPFDVVLLMAVLVSEETHRLTGKAPEPSLMRALLQWYADDEEKTSEDVSTAIEAAGGIDTKNSWWDKVVGAFVTLKGSLKYSAVRKRESVAYKLTRIDALVDVANAVLRNCAHLLRQHNGKQWLFVGEEFDKTGIPSDKQIDLFLVHGGTIFVGLEANLVFNLPLALAFGSRASELPALPRLVVYDTAVYTPEKKPAAPGRAFARTVLEARVDPALFEEGQMDRLIVASGANLRDLFNMVREAAINARVDERTVIAAEDVQAVLLNWRFQFQSRLGTTQYDARPIENAKKVERLVELYNSKDAGQELNDDVLGILLAANAVQEFNGNHWFGVHPLIVDYLKRAGKVLADAPGGSA